MQDLLAYLAGEAPQISLIKYDPIEEKVIRDKNGFCIKIKPGTLATLNLFCYNVEYNIALIWIFCT